MTDRGERGPDREAGRYQVGCERPDGTLNVHKASEVCEVCSEYPPEPPGPAQAQETCLCGKPVNAAGPAHLCSTSAAQPVDPAREAEAPVERLFEWANAIASAGEDDEPDEGAPLPRLTAEQFLAIRKAAHEYLKTAWDEGHAARRQSEEGLREALREAARLLGWSRKVVILGADLTLEDDGVDLSRGQLVRQIEACQERARAALEEPPKP
jgi:hypothetical protein